MLSAFGIQLKSKVPEEARRASSCSRKAASAGLSAMRLSGRRAKTLLSTVVPVAASGAMIRNRHAWRRGPYVLSNGR